jgi:predicted TIM-barrel fold metal-dependent hydrolase
LCLLASGTSGIKGNVMSDEKPDILLHDFRPRPRLVVGETVIMKPRFPAIDAHNHLAAPFGGDWDQRPVSELLDVLDECDVRVLVDLDGGWGEHILHAHLDKFKAAAPERFRVFGGVDWSAWPEHRDQFGEWAAQRLREQAARGAEGLKIWKPFGLHVRDQHDRLVPVDDARLDPLWQTAAELDLPVLIHVADPVAFFDPLDATNERWEELRAHPDWHFPCPPFPSFPSIMDALANLVAHHPATTFVGAHVGCYAENLAWVGALLDRCPNFYVDISARIAELGRQPYTARRFFLQYADRILFGADMAPRPAAYRVYYRFLETDDEYFSYSPDGVPTQGRWQIYGLFLPNDVLEKVYRRNAERAILRQR